ncbi:MAG: patatin-like phospholipase family protein [Acidobacteria bacterium]|jgi:NTE family protein|nr:patatin-like phospholipase family protein [Acidobacteriota bacterium]
MVRNPDDQNARAPNTTPTVGIALGAGGAKGVAHIPMLEALDELGVTPHRIAGCSIGAVFGALYASGLSAVELRDRIEQLAITKQDTVRGVFSDKKLSKWLDMIDPTIRGSGLLKSESIMDTLCREAPCETFEDLAIPFAVVATDFWEHQAVVIDSGPLHPAIQASFALPGVFPPVELDGRVLIDGGTVNPVPFDILTGTCDIVIAVDINSGSPAEHGSVPGYFSNLFGSIQIMQQAIVRRELEARHPDIYLKPMLKDFRTLQFYRADEIYRQAQPAKDQLKRELEERLEAWTST